MITVIFPAKWHKFFGLVVLLVFLLLGLAGCAPGDAYSNPTPKADAAARFQAEPATNNGNAANGQKVFIRLPCLSCHSFNGSVPTEGNAPPLDKIGTNAATRLPGVNAAQYIRHALVQPEDVRVAGYRNIMPSFSASVTPPELEDLVAYLLTLK